MASGGIERRQFFRINDRLPVQFREVAYPETVALQKSLMQSDVMFGRHEAPVGGDGAILPGKSEMHASLRAIEKKLDAVIDLLSQRQSTFESAYEDVTISGSGLMFRSAARLEQGAYLEMGVGLPVRPGYRVKALGKVVRSDPCNNQGEEGWETAVGFAAISEKDQDAIVGYVFSKEREGLRMRQMPS